MASTNRKVTSTGAGAGALGTADIALDAHFGTLGYFTAGGLAVGGLVKYTVQQNAEQRCTNNEAHNAESDNGNTPTEASSLINLNTLSEGSTAYKPNITLIT